MRDELSSELIRFINEVLPDIDSRLEQPPNVDADTPLFESGLIDSLAILHLIAFVEHATGRNIPLHQVVMKHFRSVSAICAAFGRSREERDP